MGDFFSWISELFGGGGAAVPPEPREYERYVLRDDSPFPREPVTCQVMGVLNGWVRYRFENSRGLVSDCDPPWDSPIESFRRMYRRIP